MTRTSTIVSPPNHAVASVAVTVTFFRCQLSPVKSHGEILLYSRLRRTTSMATLACPECVIDQRSCAIPICRSLFVFRGGEEPYTTPLAVSVTITAAANIFQERRWETIDCYAYLICFLFFARCVKHACFPLKQSRSPSLPHPCEKQRHLTSPHATRSRPLNLVRNTL